MLRIYFLQQWFNLSDPAVEEALIDSPLMRGFAGIDLATSLCPTTEWSASSAIFWKSTTWAVPCWRRVCSTCRTVVSRLPLAPSSMRRSFIPSSTKNREQKRDPEMHQTRKGKQWFFGMKAHIGVDSKHKIVHSAVVTPAHIADCTVLPELLHGEETKVWGDQAYRGQTEAIGEAAPLAQDLTNQRYRYKDHVDEVQKAKNRNKSRVRSKVEHVFGVIKRKFGYVKVRYRGIRKNANQVFTLCALSNLFVSRHRLLSAQMA